MEICDVMQVVAITCPAALLMPPSSRSVWHHGSEQGVLIAYGHNLAAGAEAMIYAEENGLWDKVDIGRRMLHGS